MSDISKLAYVTLIYCLLEIFKNLRHLFEKLIDHRVQKLIIPEFLFNFFRLVRCRVHVTMSSEALFNLCIAGETQWRHYFRNFGSFGFVEFLITAQHQGHQLGGRVIRINTVYHQHL